MIEWLRINHALTHIRTKHKGVHSEPLHAEHIFRTGPHYAIFPFKSFDKKGPNLYNLFALVTPYINGKTGNSLQVEKKGIKALSLRTIVPPPLSLPNILGILLHLPHFSPFLCLYRFFFSFLFLSLTSWALRPHA